MVSLTQYVPEDSFLSQGDDKRISRLPETVPWSLSSFSGVFVIIIEKVVFFVMKKDKNTKDWPIKTS